MEPAPPPARVLLVEDDPSLRRALVKLAGTLGHDASAVGSVTEALALPEQPSFDVLLTDFNLPDGSGTDVARALGERWPGLRVILLSGYGVDARDDQHPPLLTLTKPVSRQTLGDAIRSVLDAR